MALIYCATNRLNGKLYIGFSVDLHRRLITHKSSANCGCSYVFAKALRKYGFDSFDFSVLYTNDDAWYTLNVIEPVIIALFKPEYNTGPGGECVATGPMTEEHKQKMRDNHADFAGSKNPFFGRTHTERTKQILRQKTIGRIGFNRGRVFSQEVRTRMSEAAKLRYQTHVHPRIGTFHTEEAKTKMRKPKTRAK